MADSIQPEVLVYQGGKRGFIVQGYPPPMNPGDRRVITPQMAADNGTTPDEVVTFICGIYNRGGATLFARDSLNKAELASYKSDQQSVPPVTPVVLSLDQGPGVPTPTPTDKAGQKKGAT